MAVFLNVNRNRLEVIVNHELVAELEAWEVDRLRSMLAPEHLIRCSSSVDEPCNSKFAAMVEEACTEFENPAPEGATP